MRSRIGLIKLLIREGSDPGAIARRLQVRKALIGSERVLDVGCASSMHLRWYGVPYAAGLEGYRPSYEEAKRIGSHDEMVLGDVREVDRFFKPGQFDTCMAVDVIEHLPKEDGLKLMRDLERIASRKVIIITPSGFLPQRQTEAGDLQEHLSGWETEEMRGYGYQVIGLLGPKSLRGEHHHLKYRPKVFWGLISLLGHLLWTRWNPARAASILCIKEKQSAGQAADRGSSGN
jgi:hypothetical protein